MPISNATTERCATNGSTNNVFRNIREVQDTATQWLWTYNNERPNMGLGGITPAQKLNMKLNRQMTTQIAA